MRRGGSFPPRSVARFGLALRRRSAIVIAECQSAATHAVPLGPPLAGRVVKARY
jgi:hypothetical protein